MKIIGWTAKQSELLVSEATTGGNSYAQIAQIINAKFGTRYSRGAVLGRAHRLGLCKPQQFGRSEWAIENARQRDREKKQRRRVGKHAPSDLAERVERKKQNLALFQGTGTSRTSPAYRKHLPYLPEMTKTELRAMLSLAVENTALMEVV